MYYNKRLKIYKMSNLKEVNADNFETLLNDKSVAVMQFSAAWCGPCKILGPVIETLSGENEDITIGKVNIDDNKDIAIKFGVRNIPAVLFFKDGEELRDKRLVGVQPKSDYQKIIDELV